jgi:hypothetical protein
VPLKSVYIFLRHLVLLGRSNEGRRNGQGIYHAWGHRNAYRILVRKSEGKKQAGRPRSRWEDIKTDHKDIGCDYVDCIHLTQDRDQ